MQSCFIIMPISVPPLMIPSLYAEPAHFKNILEHLFVPAVKDAGYNPIVPISKGGEIIIAEVIHYLAKADMVLCDISSHNPNVFYELGIRTALDKPAAIVRDSCTTKIPFDTAAINVEEYPGDLRPWNLPAAKARITEHLKVSAEKARGRNAAWRYFGVTENAEFAPQKNTEKDKLDVILSRLDRIEAASPSLKTTEEPARRYFNTVQEYLIHGAAKDLLGQWVTISGKEAKIVAVDLRAMSLTVEIGGDKHMCNLKHAEVAGMEVIPF